ncbi:MAG: radical SAM protein [Terrimicrobiaceae bacterium]|nr:radical SAM protein [Terrimicrobiaceae bacterium]
MSATAEIPVEAVLKRTRGRCPICLADCAAEVIRRADGGREAVFMRRECLDHGATEARIATDARFYWLAQGDPGNACRTPGSACCASPDGSPGTLGQNAAGRSDGPFEKLATCLALIEIVESCNLACPVCYADSPHESSVKAAPIEDIQARVEGVIARKGEIDILQLSGGEPTLHPQFFDLLAWAQAHPGIRYVLVNTNGVRLAQDDAFLDEMAEAAARRRIQIYLQFDGTLADGQRELRGADLRALRERAIARCGGITLPVTLAMTVTRQNLANLWATAEFGMRFPHVRGVSYQPFFTSGRRTAIETAEHVPVNVADVILSLVEHSGGKLGPNDFTPLPCGDPNCATIGYLLRIDGAVRSVSEFVDFRAVQDFLRDKVRYSLDDLARCGCESEPLGGLLRRFELDESHAFRLFIKPFMDAFTWDQDRIDRCCTHVIREDGKLDSFCRYYSGFPGACCAP